MVISCRKRGIDTLIFKVVLFYLVVALFNFLKNGYRMIHANYLRNRFIENSYGKRPEKNYSLTMPITNTLSKIGISANYQEIDDATGNHYDTKQLADKLDKACERYKYLMIHCLSWIFRLPLPKYIWINGKFTRGIVKSIIIILTTVFDYLICLFLDEYGLGDKLLNLLTDFLKNLF